jgi:hypothetical protein
VAQVNKIISFDPGGTTGVAIVSYAADSNPELIEAFQVENGLEGFILWARNIDWTEFDTVVCESFTLRTGVKFPDLSPVYIIGALEAMLDSFNATVAYQAPSSKPICDDKLLKKISFYTVGRQHANDATRHAIIFLRSKRHLPTLKMCWPEE